jgi:hypothetical protein
MNPTIYEIISAAYALVSGERGRSVGEFARNEDGLKVSPFCDNAVQFCSVGAMVRSMHGAKHCVKSQASHMIRVTLDSPAYGTLYEAVSTAGFASVAEFNDTANDKQFHNTWAYALLLAKQESAK